MSTKIVARDLRIYRPYRHTSDVDFFYARLADNIMKLFDKYIIDNEVSTRDDLKDIAIAMSLYLEDIVSGLGIWQTFTEECKARYGVWLPFYDTNDSNYFHDEINEADLCFLLWHRLQSLTDMCKTIISPNSDSIRVMVRHIMPLLDAAWEEAPVNSDMQKWMKSLTFSADNFNFFRDVMMWFHYGCYLFHENQLLIKRQHKLIMNDPKLFAGHKEDMTLHFEMLNVFVDRTQLLAFTTPQWAARILRRHTDVTLINGVESRPMNCYKFLGHTDGHYTLQSLRRDKTEYVMPEQAVDTTIFDLRFHEGDYVTCHIVRYGGQWWLNGAINVVDEKTRDNNIAIEQRKDEQEESLPPLMEKFLNATGGEPVYFGKNRETTTRFMIDKLGYPDTPDAGLPPFDDSLGVVLFCTKQNGIGILHAGCKSLCSPHNEHYDKSNAADDAVQLMLNPAVLPYSVSCALRDAGMLPDAHLYTPQGDSAGDDFLQANAEFLTDYFHHRYRDADL